MSIELFGGINTNMILSKDNSTVKVLIISNNAFSKTKNNGKTLDSMFEYFQESCVAQLYFNSEAPSSEKFENFYQISDSDVVKSLFTNANKVGRKISRVDSTPMANIESSKIINNLIAKTKKSNIFRLLREVAWLSGKWDTNELNSWINNFSPDVIFLCAGDSGFAFDIAKRIRERFKTKFIVYITDDYVLPRRTLNIFWWIRRNLILNKMRKAVSESNLFITISQKMSDTYKEFLGKESEIAVNMTEMLKSGTEEVSSGNFVKMVYAGGLHSKRYESLHLLAKSIENYNKKAKKKVLLEIYSNSNPTKEILRKINIKNSSQYLGSLDHKELKIVLNNCDVPVFVESFNKKSIESTRLSLSTKIPEYLSLGKPILAIGPANVASMEYLSEVALCINDPIDIERGLQELVTNPSFRNKISNDAIAKFNTYHNADILKKKFKSNIESLVKTKEIN